jgi:hypothetical protein
MPTETMRQPPPAPDADIPLIIPVDFRSGTAHGAWIKVVLAGLVVFSLALAALVWSQLLRGVP